MFAGDVALVLLGFVYVLTFVFIVFVDVGLVGGIVVRCRCWRFALAAVVSMYVCVHIHTLNQLASRCTNGLFSVSLRRVRPDSPRGVGCAVQ